MSARSRLRLVVLQVLVLALLATLGGRLWYVQVLAADRYQQAAADNRIREVAIPAARGLILDDRGRALARNGTSMVVSVDRTTLLRQPDGGERVLRRLARVLDRPLRELRGRTSLCGSPEAPDPPSCWNGSPYQSIPVTDDVGTDTVLRILERREDFPGVTAEVKAARHYPKPLGANAAHVLGYLGAVTEAELDEGLPRGDLAGRAGLESRYDAELRGRPGVRRLAVDHQGRVTGTVGERPPVTGHSLVTSLDAKVQAVAERELRAAIQRARTEGDVNKDGKRYRADSGAVVVLDVRTGRVVAMASWPAYDPNVWVGGISTKDYRGIMSAERNVPVISRAFQGEFAPASTFKVVTLPAAVRAGYSVDANYPCPSTYQIGNSRKANYESQGFGTISMEQAIEVSCDTVFYKFAYETWLRMGGAKAGVRARDPFHRMASGFGLGRPTGVDLPGERAGRIPDRRWKRAYWQQTRRYHCAQARTGYPDVERSDPERARYLTRLSRENCADGYVYRGGDAANFAIGQGDVLVTPLQMAVVYSAIANGGTLWRPSLAKVLISPSGRVVKRFAPRRAGRAPLDAHTLAFLQRALTEVTREGTGRGPFERAGFPLDRIPVASKTGTAEVYGKQTTSWFASYAPADAPRYAVVMMVSQGGTGSGVSGPSVAAIYKELFGVEGTEVDPRRGAIPGVDPPSSLPVIRPDGSVAPPRERRVP